MSALAFLTLSRHDQPTFAKQPIHATPWHSARLQAWSRLLKDSWGLDSTTCLCHQFLNLTALPGKTFNYLQRESNSIVSNSISGEKDLLKPKQICLQIPSSYTIFLSPPTPQWPFTIFFPVSWCFSSTEIPKLDNCNRLITKYFKLWSPSKFLPLLSTLLKEKLCWHTRV